MSHPPASGCEVNGWSGIQIAGKQLIRPFVAADNSAVEEKFRGFFDALENFSKNSSFSANSLDIWNCGAAEWTTRTGLARFWFLFTFLSIARESYASQEKRIYAD
jgi:hypothetical protein